MRILDQYLGVTILRSVAITLFVILGFNFMFAMLDEIDNLNERYTLAAAALVVLGKIPSELFEFLPASTLIGCLIGLGLLAQNNELTIIRNTLSPIRLIWATAKPVFVIVIAGLLVAEYVAPSVLQLSDKIKQQAKGEELTSNLNQALWTRDQSNFIFINRVETDGSLAGVRVFHYNDDLVMTRYIQAEQATLQENGWVLDKVQLIDGLPEVARRTELSTMRWDTSLTTKFLQVQAHRPTRLSLSDLYFYSNYLSGQKMDNTEYVFELWDRLLQPLTCLSLMLLSFSFIFGSGRDVSIGDRVFQGILVGVSLNIVRDVLAQFALSFNLSPFVMAFLPVFFIAALAMFLIYKKR